MPSIIQGYEYDIFISYRQKALFRDDPLLKSLHEFSAYNDLLKKMKITWEKFRLISKE